MVEENSGINKTEPFEWNFIDQDIEVESIPITIFDPFSREVMEIPVRGSKCRHLQCFDLLIFLKLTQVSESRSWKCPYCGYDSRKLIIDKYQLQLIEDVKKKDSLPKRIVFFRDGTIDHQYI